MHTFPKTGAESYLKRNLEYKNILYNSTEHSVYWKSRDVKNQTKLFSKKF